MKRVLPLLLLALLLPGAAPAYPVDGYAYTGIRRLEDARLVHAGEIPGRRRHGGQYLAMADVQPRWHDSDGRALPPVDLELGQAIAALVPRAQRADYAIAVLDLSDPRRPVYAAHQAGVPANVGSVGKILVALALFQQLADLYPDDIAARERVLRNTRVTADAFSQYDSHVVPFFDVAARQRRGRAIRVGDEASLWEFLDWMLSASSNSAAGMVQKELIALAHFGRRYPVPPAEAAAFFAGTGYNALGAIMSTAMAGALVKNGLDPEKIRQGSFFTRGGNRRVGGTTSFATAEQLVQLLFRIEAGTLVDAFSSRELKRLLYLTQRRIRYASHPALNEAAVSFKSGSYFQCHAGPRGCRKYKGDKTNRLASLAIVEPGAAAPAPHYLVVVMSNVLGVNSAVAHQTLAMRIHRLLQARHPAPRAPPPVPESSYATVPVDDPDAHESVGP